MPPSAPSPCLVVGHHFQVGSPARRFGGVGHEEGWCTEGAGQFIDDAIQDAAAADHFQALGPTLEAGGATARQNDAPHAQ